MMNKTMIMIIIVIVTSATIIGFGATLFEDGFTDAKKRHPSVKRQIDLKELSIAGGFIFVGLGGVAIPCIILRPQYKKKTFLVVGIALAYMLVIAFITRMVGIRFIKPHWFTTNITCKVKKGNGEYSDAKIRLRTAMESISNTIRMEQK